MNIKDYSPRIRALMEKVDSQKSSMEEEVLATLDELITVAEEEDDNWLKGFSYFHLADAFFAFEKDYSAFRENLGRAIYYFNKSDEKELLARSYNLVAIDALNSGSYDVAYLYLMNAMQTCEEIDNPYLMSIINNNIGQLFARMKSFEKAVAYVRLGNDLQLLCPQDDFYFIQNMINGYFSEGSLCSLMGDLEGAKEANRKIEDLQKENDITNISSIFIPIMLLRLMIAILEEDKDQCEIRSRELLHKLRESHRIYDFITDIEDLCSFLIQHGYLETTGEILDIIKHTIEATEVIQMKRIISSIELAYYEKIGATEKVTQCLREQYRLSEQQQMEQNLIYQYSIDLINIMNEQRKEQEKVKRENEYLHSRVQTDPLTGIPNRLMLDSIVPPMFEEAQKEGRYYGVSLMDINRFKGYNDTYGHLAGDICLQKIAKAIAKISERPGVFCVRFGGDEFIMLYDNKTDQEIMEIAEELNKEIYDLNIVHSAMGEGGRVSLSQGICNSIPGPDNIPADYLNEADNALYAVKKTLDSPGKTKFIRLVHV